MNLLQFPGSSSEFSLDTLEIECQKDYGSVLYEVLQGESDNQTSRYWRLEFLSLISCELSVVDFMLEEFYVGYLCGQLTSFRLVIIKFGNNPTGIHSQ